MDVISTQYTSKYGSIQLLYCYGDPYLNDQIVRICKLECLSALCCVHLIFREISEVSQIGGSIIFHHVQANSELKTFFRSDPGQSDMGLIIFHHVHAKSELKNFRQDPGQSDGGSIIFHHVQAKSELKNFRQDPAQSDGGQSSFTMSRLNLNWKILGEILVSQTGGSLSTDQHTHTDFISCGPLGCV